MFQALGIQRYKRFALISCRLHAAVKVEGVICVNNDVEYNNICPALGINTFATHDWWKTYK